MVSTAVLALPTLTTVYSVVSPSAASILPLALLLLSAGGISFLHSKQWHDRQSHPDIPQIEELIFVPELALKPDLVGDYFLLRQAKKLIASNYFADEDILLRAGSIAYENVTLRERMQTVRDIPQSPRNPRSPDYWDHAPRDEKFWWRMLVHADEDPAVEFEDAVHRDVIYKEKNVTFPVIPELEEAYPCLLQAWITNWLICGAITLTEASPEGSAILQLHGCHNHIKGAEREFYNLLRTIVQENELSIDRFTERCNMGSSELWNFVVSLEEQGASLLSSYQEPNRRLVELLTVRTYYHRYLQQSAINEVGIAWSDLLVYGELLGILDYCSTAIATNCPASIAWTEFAEKRALSHRLVRALNNYILAEKADSPKRPSRSIKQRS